MASTQSNSNSSNVGSRSDTTWVLQRQQSVDRMYAADLDTVLDALRQNVMEHRPENVFEYMIKTLSDMAKNPNGLERCERILLKVQPQLMERPLTIIVLGASGDLAKKKTFPALFQLYCNGLLPPKVNIVGYARTKIADVEKWKHEALVPRFERLEELGCHVDAFLQRISYVSGRYDADEGFQHLHKVICDMEAAFYNGKYNKAAAAAAAAAAPQQQQQQQAAAGNNNSTSSYSNSNSSGSGSKAYCGNRLFYLALPPTAFVDATRGIRRNAMPQSNECWIRVVIEKPFGKDTESARKMASDLEPYFNEDVIYRIDHYLGKEMVQNIITTRFANRIFSSLWNNNNIACVQITFKETIGTGGRGGYFDEYGIIRDVMQNHLTQILALVAMEKPHTLDAEDIRDEKVALLRCIPPVTKENCVLGQYTASADGSVPGYRDDATVAKDSKCPTFAVIRLDINNDRWHGVPFLLKAGKALEQKFVGIRIQFKDEIRPYGDATTANEIVIRAQPSEAMYMKITTKTPGLMEDLRHTHQTELDLTYQQRYAIHLPDAYESLINDILLGNSTNFVRKDELEAAWQIFTPLLHQIDKGELEPIPYQAGTRGPAEADQFLVKNGFKKQQGYHWLTPANKL